ncbi:hypothetical protein AB7M17_007177 [Bradyrhizobium sp. USDA 377]
MGVAVVFLMMIIQPAIIGYIAQKQLQKPGAGRSRPVGNFL